MSLSCEHSVLRGLEESPEVWSVAPILLPTWTARSFVVRILERVSEAPLLQ